jgi:hypothetical protein
VYQQALSRQNPGCIVFLVDRSYSMGERWGSTGMSLADGAAQAINRILLELCIKSIKEPGAPPRPYFYVGIYGYGMRPRAGGEGVESALPEPLAHRGIVPLPELAEHPIDMHAESGPPAPDAMPDRPRVPIYYRPAFGNGTPMCAAIALAGSHVNEWAKAYPDSYPPVLINITDGLVTDSPFEGRDLASWAARVATIRTNDGNALMLNAFLAASDRPVTSFPSTADNLPRPGPELFAMSSLLPDKMIDNARAAHVDVRPGARGFVFNADLATLVKFLEIGTRQTVHHG